MPWFLVVFAAVTDKCAVVKSLDITLFGTIRWRIAGNRYKCAFIMPKQAPSRFGLLYEGNWGGPGLGLSSTVLVMDVIALSQTLARNLTRPLEYISGDFAAAL